MNPKSACLRLVVGASALVLSLAACDRRQTTAADPPPAAPPAARAAGNQLFYEDFEGAALPAWEPNAGEWEVRDLPGGGKQYGAPRARKQHVLSVAGNGNWKDYVVDARVTIQDDRSGPVGIAGRVQDSHFYYELLLGRNDAGKKGWFLRQRLRHQWTNLAAGAYEYELGVPQTLRLAIKGQHLEASVSPDGRSFVKLGGADSQGIALTQGKVGAVGYGGDASWDDFHVTGDFIYDQANPWGPLIEIRDTSGFFSGAPAGGWYVAAIHANLRASDGRIVISGYSRKGVASCTSGTDSSQNGTSWILDPNAAAPPTLFIQPINEQPLVSPDDVMYCSGHVTLPGGRVFYSGGSRHPGGFPFSSERGLNYSRVFNWDSSSFTRVSVAAKGGTIELPGEKWYPTSILLPDGDTLTFGGFTFNSGGTGPRMNQSLELFDPSIWDANQAADPWTVLTTHAEGQADTVPTRGYTNLFLLPKPLSALNGGGFARTVALAGGVGRVFLFNHEPGPGGAERLLAKAHATTPNMSATEKGEGASGVVLPDGRLMFVNGGHLGSDSAKVYFYDPTADAWSSNALFNSRIYGDALWLPDGRVMIINGYVSEPGNTNDVTNPIGDVRSPEIIDPWTNPPTITALPAWPDAFWRGYHSISVVLKDARILVAAGKDDTHATGCEKSNMRIFEPPYLFGAGGRPTINLPEGVPMTVGGAALTVPFTGTVRSTRGVALMAPGSLTHGFDMGQRYVPLNFTDNGNGTLTVQPPENINIAPPGEYLLYLVSNTGVPSLGKYVQLAPPPVCRYAVSGIGDSYIEAEARSRQSGPFAAVTDAARSGGAYLGVTEGSGSHTTEPDEGKVLWYDVNVSAGGTFTLWALGNGPDTGSDSFWASVDGMPDVQLTLPAASWGWVAASGTLNLPDGKHTIKIKVREDGSLIDKILLTKLGTTPTGLGGTALSCTGPSAPAAPTATPGDKQVALSWSAVAGATGYTVKRSTTSGGNYIMVQSNISGTSFTNFGLQNGTQYFFVVSASNAAAESPNSPQTSATPTAPPPPTWTSQDIGAVATPGSWSLNSMTGVHTVVGNGADIWNTVDEFRFTYQTLTGDGNITARLLTFTGTGTINANAKAGVMIRQDLTAGSPQLLSCLPVQGQTTLIKQIRRLTANTSSASTTGASPTYPRWVRVTRAGNTLSTWESTDNMTWTQVGTAQTISTLGASTFVGLAVTSHVDGTNYTATFDNVTVNPAVMNAPPTVATAAAATPSPAPGTTTALSVLGADDAGEAALTYTWSTTGSPPAPVTFSANGNNAAKNTTATFTKAGNYDFQVVIRDAGNLTVTSSVSMTVSQTLTSIVVAPASASVPTNGTQQFTATARDQFATALGTQPSFTWMVSGGGTIDSAGLFTATTPGGPFTVTATSGAINGTAQVTVTVPNEPPTVATPAAASPDPAPGTTTALSVLGADDGGEAALIYTWSTTGSPPAPVSFSANGTNAAKNTTATFTKAGSYSFQVVIQDTGSLTATSAVTMTVSQTLTSIVVTPASASVATNATQQFSATARDQFATALTSQPSFSWMVSGGGTISTGGLFTAGATAGGPFTVTATSGAVNGTAQVTVTAGPLAPSNLGATITGGNQANLTWTDNSSNETGFRVERKVGTGSFTTLATKAANTTSHPDPGLAVNTTYTYRVIATGTPDSAPSNEVVVVIRNNSADAHVRGGVNANNNYGANTTIEVKNNATVDNNRQAFVRFSIADVAPTVTSAKIRLFGASATSTKIIAVSAVTDTSWVEGTGTIMTPVTATGIDFNNKPLIGSQLSSLSVTTTAGYWEFDITSHVQAQRTAGASQVSLAITMVTSSTETQTSFNARENTANKPVVVIASK